MREERNIIPIYPLILWPKGEDYDEMAEMFEDYVEQRRPYWQEIKEKINKNHPDFAKQFDLNLREVVKGFMYVRDSDEPAGFAAANLLHARKVWLPQTEKWVDEMTEHVLETF